MGWLLVAALVVTAAGVTLLVVTSATRRRTGTTKTEQRPARLAGLVAIALGGVVVVAVVAAEAVDTFRRRGLPPPEYASLVASPDPSLHGTVAYLSEAKSPAAGRQACARVAAASGAESKDAYCWRIGDSASATVVWRPDGRLLVTSFDAPVGKNTLIPKWAKLVDVNTGATQDVPKADLGEHARPSTGPTTNAEGQRLVKTGKDGNVTIALVGPSGSRTVFSVKDANPDWGLQTGPIWSPDFEWFLAWDGTRLLVTTVDRPTTTRVLAAEASGGAFSFDVPGFSITARDYPGG